MKRVWAASLGALVLSVATFAGTAHAVTGTGAASSDTVNYKYTSITGPDSSTCGGNWANDKETRTFKVYREQANNGSYQVTETFTGGSFTTLAGDSPEKCEAGTSNVDTAGIKGSFHGYETLIVSNADISGNWVESTNVSCSATCTTDEWIANTFGADATFTTANDWWFTYKTTNAHACAKHWINAAYGNSGDIATTCSAPAE